MQQQKYKTNSAFSRGDLNFSQIFQQGPEAIIGLEAMIFFCFFFFNVWTVWFQSKRKELYP